MRKLIVLFYLIPAGFLQAQNYVSTYAGSLSGYADGDTSAAKFHTPFGMCIDKDDNLYIADQDGRIRKITQDGIVSTLAGTGVAGYADGPGITAQFNSPANVCVDGAGNVFVADFENQRIRKITADGTVSTIAGNGVAGYLDGEGTDAEFNYPRGIVLDSEGNLYVGDSWNHRIRKIEPGGLVTTFAGGGDVIGVSSVGSYVDGTDTSARFYTPCGLTIDAGDTIYVADAYNHRIRKITPDGLVTTLAGSGLSGDVGGGFADGTAASAIFDTPTEVFCAPDRKIYVGDTYNNRVRVIDQGVVSTLAGNGISGYVDGIDTAAEFKFTRGVVLDAAGEHVYVCDYNNHRIRKITFHLTTPIDNILENDQISMFPNPTMGAFEIDLPNAPSFLPFAILITDMSGSLICVESGGAGNTHFNIQKLPKGIYFVKIISGNKTIQKKLVVE